MHKRISAQVDKCTGGQVDKRTSGQVHKWASSQVDKLKSRHVPRDDFGQAFFQSKIALTVNRFLYRGFSQQNPNKKFDVLEFSQNFQ